MLFILKIVNLSEMPKPKQIDFEILSQILAILKYESLTYSQVIKEIKKLSFVKVWEKERKEDLKKQGKPIKKVGIRSDRKIEMILATLGVCGVLHTDAHKGPFYEYRLSTELPRGNNGKYDGDYPVCWWKTNEGIDCEAFDFWFGDYPEIIK